MSKSKLGMLTLHCTRLIGAGTTINTNNSVHWDTHGHPDGKGYLRLC